VKIDSQSDLLVSPNGFPWGSIIGSSLANFTLNGLEGIIKASKAARTSLEKNKYPKATPKKPLIDNNPTKLIADSGLVRYGDDFIMVTNFEEEISFLKEGVEKFLLERGLEINKVKIKVVK
jgi:hypothetical protein